MRFEKKEIKTKNGGITLIALVITIIVLLILAGVTIAMLVGDNGILTKTTEAQSEQDDATIKEAISLAWNEYQIEINESTGELTENAVKIASTENVTIRGEEQNYLAEPTMSFFDFLKDEKGYINDNGVVNVQALIGETLSKGNGTDNTTDVYKIEETEDNKYMLVYCDKNGIKEELSKFEENKTESIESTDPNLFAIYRGSIGVKEWNSYYTEGKEWPVEDVIIPSEINGEKVTSIGQGFFCGAGKGFKNIKTVVIPEGVEIIGNDAFRLSNISYIVIPSTVEIINNRAFEGWGPEQTIQVPFKEGTQFPEGWGNNLGNATIKYAE